MVRKQKAAKAASVVFRSVRLPLDVTKWLEKEAQRTGASQNSEIVRSVRSRMDAERRETRALERT
jgi:hypothetical protein